MAIPGIPQNMYCQTGNQQNLVSWDMSPGATSYIVQSSLDNVTFTTLATVSGSPLATSYLDTAATLGAQTWYKVAASNSDGTSSYTNAQSITAAPVGEMTLGQIRLASQQTADRLHSDFVTKPEWNDFIDLAMSELYDLLVTTYEDYSVAVPVRFTTDGSSSTYTLPNGSNTFTNDAGATITPRPFLKLLGVDLATPNSSTGFVSVRKFNFIDRNRESYPSTASVNYGVNNLEYRVVGKNIQFMPTPAASQTIRLWYVPRLIKLLQDTDTSDIGISGWLRYVIVRAAKYALDKEESDTSKLDAELLFLKARIEESAANRDAGQADRISDTRQIASGSYGGGWNGGF